MNGLEFLYHLLFVEVDKGLWLIILLGVFFKIISIFMDFVYDETLYFDIMRENLSNLLLTLGN